ncbi:S41 family peptidase [Maribellus sediminis]|uniref:S41 family peptidase n=1 Tax=Maribellus sediminis TaxID=2696285 RepID=UPI001430CB6E|nr:S41 family peptidase [Maribellus sediminis]
MKKLILIFWAVLLNLLAVSQDSPTWLRYSAISPDGQTIVFSYKGDLYKVPSTGGTAISITFNDAYDYRPVWSHDGKTIAFASDRYGNFDVFTMKIDGGEVKRLTFHSNNELPYSFSADDNSVIFGAHRMDSEAGRLYPTGYQPELYSVPSSGGRVKMIFTTPAEAVCVSKNGEFMLYHDKTGGENEWRKHHVSSVARDIWQYDFSSGEHKKITSYAGEDRNPVLADDDKTVYFLSEESGSFNVYKLNLNNPQEREQLTDFKKFPVRYLSRSNNGTLCFSYDGELYTLKSGQPEKVNIVIHTEGKSNNEQIIPISGNADEMAVAPNGKEIAFIARGEVFVTSVEGGVTKKITDTPEQERFLSFTPDGEGLVYASEREGRWQVFKSTKVRKEEPYFYASTLIREEALVSSGNDSYQPKVSPDGKEVAYIENRTSLKVFNIESKTSRTILTPDELFYMGDGDQYFTWSPDSKWLLVSVAPVLSNSEVMLISADGNGKMHNLTKSGYDDAKPKWVNGGKQMLWFSTRDGLRSYANSGARQTDIYSLFFTQEAWDRFNLSKEDYALLKDIEAKEKEKEAKAKAEEDKKGKKGEKAETVKKDTLLTFDWENMEERKARLTLTSASMGDALLSKDGEKLYFLAKYDKDMNLWSIDLRKKEAKMEVALNVKRGGEMVWDKDKKNIFLLADSKISKIDLEKKKSEPVKINGELNIDKEAEYQAMFKHVVERTKKGFYSKAYHGVDWDENAKDHEKYLSGINNGYDFAEMLSEMLGELNSSHSGARYTPKPENGDNTASLGIFIDYAYEGDGVKIAGIISEGPMDKANIKVKTGFIIQQIDGDSLLSDRDLSEFLNRKQDKFTLLKVLDPSSGSTQEITVKPISLGEEGGLLYKAWVKRNQAEVDSLSKGQLGYVHIPGMSDGPYRVIYEEMMGKYYDRKGIVVDTRNNAGGDLVSDLTMFLTGKKYIEYGNDSRMLGSEPPFRWTNPTVAMFNEANYSDGHCFACGYSQLGIGKTIGMPVPGTCSWASWETLADKNIRWGMVPVSSKDMYGHWMENQETVPDYVIKNDPKLVGENKDQQLEKAVEVLLEMVK